MSQNYQHGYLRRAKRKSGAHRWEFLWRENDKTGKRIRRTAIIGTVEQYPTEELARLAANGLRMQINADHNRYPVHSISIGDLIDHYVQTELSVEAGWHFHATRTVYRYFLKKWIDPHWGEVALRCVRTIAVEHWLDDYNVRMGLRWLIRPRQRSAISLAWFSIMLFVVNGSSRAEIPPLSLGRVRSA